MAKQPDYAKDPQPPPATLPATIPSFMEQYKGAGTEGVGKQDLEIPRIKLLQALSPECTEFDDAKAGVFWHTLADESLGKALKMVAVYTDISYILWRPRHQGGGILARAADGVHWAPANASFEVQPKKDNKETAVWKTASTVVQSGLDQWGSSLPSDPNSQPAATKMYNIAVIFPDLARELSPAVLTLQRSAISVAQKFMGKLKISNLPSFGQYYMMESTEEHGQLGTFFTFKFTKAGLVQDETEFNAYKDTYLAFKKMGLNIKDLEDAQDDDNDTPKGENEKF
jgi:hypothetical protein